MKTVTITLALEDDKFNEMEKILLDNGYSKENGNEEDWIKLVIEAYYDTEPYLDHNKGDLEAAYKDMMYDC